MRLSEIINERVEMIPIESYYTGKGRRVAAEIVKNVRLHINPTQREVERMGAKSGLMRFIIGTDDQLYVCVASDATHFDIVFHAGIDEMYAGYMEPGKISIRRDASIREMGPLLRANEHVLDAMGGANFQIDKRYEAMADF